MTDINRYYEILNLVMESEVVADVMFENSGDITVTTWNDRFGNSDSIRDIFHLKDYNSIDEFINHLKSILK